MPGRSIERLLTLALITFALRCAPEAGRSAGALEPQALSPEKVAPVRAPSRAHLVERTASRRIHPSEPGRPSDVPVLDDARPPSPERLRASDGPVRRAVPEASMAARLVPPIEGAHFALDRGSRLVAAIAALPADRRALGVAGLTELELFGPHGNDGLCERPALDLTLVHGGETYEARYEADIYTWVGAPQPVFYALTSTCVSALLTAGSTVADAVGAGRCTREDEAAHFPSGSRCRTCLVRAGGDHAACIAEGACKVERPREVFARLDATEEAYDVLEAPMLGCAPNLLTTATMLVRELGEDDVPPRAFDHGQVVEWCYPAWNGGRSQVQLYCYFNEVNQPRLAYADMIAGFVDWIRLPGDPRVPLHDRLFFVPGAEVDGMTFAAMPLFPKTLGTVSESYEENGWNLNPNALRPDGTDPNRIDDTFARDWLAAMGLKTSTNIDGVPIYTYNRNLCEADKWRGPDAKGRSFCEVPPFSGELQPPDDDRWRYDWGAYVYSFNPLTVEIAPVATLASTGLPDPSVPGGHLPHVLGSTTLADPDWENCRWPETFEPDEMANYDTPDFHQYTFISQTYRFGRDPNLPIRMVLATNRKRAFCFEGLTPR